MVATKLDTELIQHAGGHVEWSSGSVSSSKLDWVEEFQAQCERNLARSIEQRMHYGFCYVYKPVLDDAEWRAFDSTEEYRRWCRENLPIYLGYGAPDALQRRILDEEG